MSRKEIIKDNKKMIPVFLDLEDPNNDISTDEKVGKSLIARFIADKQGIGRRVKQMINLGFSYGTRSVKLYHQAKELYCLGYFESAIMVCRTTAEHLAYEVFFERIDIVGEREMIELLAESLDFRKIVNDFLCSTKRDSQLIDDDSKKLFNDIYDLGNKWVHPKWSEQSGLDVENEAKRAVEMLRELIDSLRNVFDDYQIGKESLKTKTSSVGKYKRGIKF